MNFHILNFLKRMHWIILLFKSSDGNGCNKRGLPLLCDDDDAINSCH